MLATQANELELPMLLFRGRAVARMERLYADAVQTGRSATAQLRGIDGPARGEYAIPATPALLALLDTLDHLLADEASLA